MRLLIFTKWHLTPRTLAGSAILLFIFLWFMLSVFFLVIHGSTARYIFFTIDTVPRAQVAVIPGAAVLTNGALSPVFRDRVDMASAIYKAGKVEKILVTGDNSSIAYNEVNPVRLYLMARGVPSDDIFLDHAGFDTYSSMFRARDIFLTESIIVVTQSFHLSRAVYTAQHLGIPAVGMSADNGHYLFSNYLREIFANGKTMFNLLIHSQPKYLGNEIPITGNGGR